VAASADSVPHRYPWVCVPRDAGPLSRPYARGPAGIQPAGFAGAGHVRRVRARVRNGPWLCVDLDGRTKETRAHRSHRARGSRHRVYGARGRVLDSKRSRACTPHPNSQKALPRAVTKGWFRIYDPTPTAWDFAINRVGPAFVRVLLDDGRWVGGYAGPDSFYTGYPEAREIFVERGWQVNEQGEFAGEVENTAGRWIKCDDAVVVEFIKPAEPAAETKGSRATKLGWTLLVLGLVVVRWCRGEGSDGRG
jgi:hypothetical protein